MKLIADTHTHTIASTHAYSTLQEMVHAAAEKKLFSIAITDHGTTMPGAPGRWYFQNMDVVPHMLEGVLVLRGQETNVIDLEGHTDLAERDLQTLDWVVASIHDHCMVQKSATVEEATHIWLKIAENPHVNVIGHSGSDEYKYDYETVLPEFGRNGKLVELNEHTFIARRDSVTNCAQIMKLCKKYSVPIIVDSDAHFSTQVGNFEKSLRLLREIEFPEELVVNSSEERFRAYLKAFTNVYSDPTLN